MLQGHSKIKYGTTIKNRHINQWNKIGEAKNEPTQLESDHFFNEGTKIHNRKRIISSVDGEVGKT